MKKTHVTVLYNARYSYDTNRYFRSHFKCSFPLLTQLLSETLVNIQQTLAIVSVANCSGSCSTSAYWALPGYQEPTGIKLIAFTRISIQVLF